MANLQDKVILIGGGATGIGAETARRLSAAGATVVIGDLNLEAAESVAVSLAEAGGRAAAVFYDQADADTIVALVDRAIEQFTRLDGVFANAADLATVLNDGDLLSNDSAIWERTLHVNVTGTAMLLRACLPRLLEAGGGSMVCTSSAASVIGEPERPAYAASKAAVQALCRHVASRWGKQGIRCNALAPGLVITPQLAEAIPEDIQQQMLQGVRSSRHGTPEDIAAAVEFLLSDDAAWVNGQTWHVNGGVSLAN